MLNDQERKIVVDLLSQISLPINQAPIVLAIIEKLKKPVDISEKSAIKI